MDDVLLSSWNKILIFVFDLTFDQNIFVKTNYQSNSNKFSHFIAKPQPTVKCPMLMNSNLVPKTLVYTSVSLFVQTDLQRSI